MTNIENPQHRFILLQSSWLYMIALAIKIPKVQTVNLSEVSVKILEDIWLMLQEYNHYESCSHMQLCKNYRKAQQLIMTTRNEMIHFVQCCLFIESVIETLTVSFNLVTCTWRIRCWSCILVFWHRHSSMTLLMDGICKDQNKLTISQKQLI